MERSESLVVRALTAFTVPVSDKTVWIILELQFENAPSGWGEATLSGAEEAVLAEIRHAQSLLAGKTLAGPGEALAVLRVAHPAEPRLIVMRAVEQALLDALARRAGLSLAALLGGPGRRLGPGFAHNNLGASGR